MNVGSPSPVFSTQKPRIKATCWKRGPLTPHPLIRAPSCWAIPYRLPMLIGFKNDAQQTKPQPKTQNPNPQTQKQTRHPNPTDKNNKKESHATPGFYQRDPGAELLQDVGRPRPPRLRDHRAEAVAETSAHRARGPQLVPGDGRDAPAHLSEEAVG